MPQLRENVAEGTIGKWLKKIGDEVALDEPLLEVVTDKVNAEVPSPFVGVLREILVKEGQTVPFEAETAAIEEAAGSVATPRGEGTAAAKAAAPTPAAASPAAASAAVAAPTAAAPPAAGPTAAAPPAAAPAKSTEPAPQPAPPPAPLPVVAEQARSTRSGDRSR